MNPYKPYREYAKAHLSDERYRHTKNVVEQAGALARHHGADEAVCGRPGCTTA